MRRVWAWVVVVMVGVVMGGLMGPRAEAQQDRGGPDRKPTPLPSATVVRKGADESTEPVRITRPTPVRGSDLVAEFGADLGYLDNVGFLVDASRQYGDAAGLAVAARIVRRAETATGRTSRAVTASGLLVEAERLAVEYQDAAGALVVATILRELEADGGARADLLVAQAQSWKVTPPVKREAGCVLVIRNPTRHRVDIWVNNRYLATMAPYDTRKATVPRGVVRLCAVGRFDPWRWGPVERVAGKQFVWLLEKP